MQKRDSSQERAASGARESYAQSAEGSGSAGAEKPEGRVCSRDFSVTSRDPVSYSDTSLGPA